MQAENRAKSARFSSKIQSLQSLVAIEIRAVQSANLVSFRRLVNADIFFFLGIFAVKFESGHSRFMKTVTGFDGTQFRLGGIFRKSELVGELFDRP